MIALDHCYIGLQQIFRSHHDENINLFFTPQQIASGEAPINKRIRAGGMVVEGSVKRSTQGLEVEFKLTDYAETITVVYEGILPDLFREGQGIVAQGSLNENRVLEAVEVLAKHDEKYMPPEVTQALSDAQAASLVPTLSKDQTTGVEPSNEALK